MNIPRIILSGITSSVGKTSIATAIMHGIKKRGYSVQPFKVGPDFIDPSYHTAVAQRASRNLDPWLMGSKGVLKSFILNSKADISVTEGVMGYFDGYSGNSNFSSTYHVANIIKSPVILVLDASKTARSIAATALGFTRFQKTPRISGLILNKIGSKKHENLCKQALKPLRIPIVGVIPRETSFHLESKHLGLIPVKEEKSLQRKIISIAKLISDFIDIDKIIEISKKTTSLPDISAEKKREKRIKIAVALDESFNFYYQDNLDALQREGAELVFFSPVVDKKIPSCDGLYIGGGFPEVKGQLLEKNPLMKKSMKKSAEAGIPIYAECGGLMYLTKSIRYRNKKFRMVGLFDAETIMQQNLKLNYTKATTFRNCIISGVNKTIRGHEFHFSDLESVDKDSKFAYDVEIGVGVKKKKDGLVQYNALASYMHLHFAQPNLARNFVENCVKYSRR